MEGGVTGQDDGSDTGSGPGKESSRTAEHCDLSEIKGV